MSGRWMGLPTTNPRFRFANPASDPRLDRHGIVRTLIGSLEARVAELADALSSGGSDRKVVQVRILPRALIWIETERTG